MMGAPLTQERSFERWTSVHERCTREHREIASGSFERLSIALENMRDCRIYLGFGMSGASDCLEQDLQDFLGFSG